MLATALTIGTNSQISYGSGKGLCLLMKRCGMGDHIQSLPVVNELAKVYDVTIFCNPFLFSLYKNIPATLRTEEEVVTGFTQKNLPTYERIYSLAEWSIDEEIGTEGNPVTDRTTFFANLFDEERPDRFSWRDSWGLGNRNPKEYIVLATETGTRAAHIFRSYPKALNLYFLLKDTFNVRWVGYPPTKYREMTNSCDELIELVDGAKAVLSVDNGIMHLAMSLGVPTFSLFGVSNELTITEPYAHYLPDALRMVMRSALYSDECMRPCNGHYKKGFGVNGKCNEGADCMSELIPEQILNHFTTFVGD